MAKQRIVKRGNKYTIQEKHLLFRWWWVDRWVNSIHGASHQDTFDSLEEAKEHLKPNKQPQEEVVFETD